MLGEYGALEALAIDRTMTLEDVTVLFKQIDG